MKRLRWLLLPFIALSLTACDNNMRDQARYDTFEKSDFFKDGMASRPLIEGTVARGHLNEDEHLYTGKVDGKHAETFPFEITADVLARGRERYNIYCSVCHDRAGFGRGMVVRRGFKQPTSFHDDRLRQAPPGYFFDVMTNGFGAMYDYAMQIKPQDRWAIAAYIRVLQLSQNAPATLLTPEEKNRLNHPQPNEQEKANEHHG